MADNLITPKNNGSVEILDNQSRVYPAFVGYTTDGNNNIVTFSGASLVGDNLITPKNKGQVEILGNDGRVYPVGVLYTTDGSGNVIPITGGGGGSSTWGSITGTLSDQTDLQNALNGKANISGQAFTGNISVTKTTGNADITVESGSATDNKDFSFKTAGTHRFVMRVDQASDDFEIRRHNDLGVFIDDPFSITRATGYVSILNRLGINTASPAQAFDVRSSTDAGATTGDLLVDTVSATPKVTVGRQSSTVGANGCFEVVDRTGSVIFSVNRSNQAINTALSYFGGTSKLGFGTNTPTHSITLASTATGYVNYNTVDQVTNYERFRASWTTNTLVLGNEFGGTGNSRSMQIGVSATSGGAPNRIIQINPGTPPFFSYSIGGTGLAGFLVDTGGNNTFSASASQQGALSITPTIVQTSTAGFRSFFVSPQVTSQGSGSNFLVDIGTNSAAAGGGTHTSKFSIGVSGQIISSIAGQTIPYSSTGMGFAIAPGTVTDSTSTGTVASITLMSISSPTYAASSATTYTTASTLTLAAPVAGTNVTFTNTSSALNVTSGLCYFSGGLGTATAVTTTNFYTTGGSGLAATSSSTAQLSGSTQVYYRILSNASGSASVGVSASYGSSIIGSSALTSAASGTHAIFSNLAVKAIGTITSGGATVTNTASIYIEGAATGGTNNYSLMVAAGNSYHDGKISYGATNTASGTTGAQTINKASGTVNFAAAATSLVVTNSLVIATSIVMAVIRTNDTTAVIKNVVPAAGSFTITLNAAATAETSVGFFVIN